MLRLLLATAVAALLAAPAAARAAEPTMPLADVRAGLRCTAATVVQGTQVTTFDAEVLDVLRADRPEDARILLRSSGAAVAGTGLGPGFSGSPVSCPDAAGTPRVVGAISESVGDFGGDVALATPIEAILAEPAVWPDRDEGRRGEGRRGEGRRGEGRRGEGHRGEGLRGEGGRDREGRRAVAARGSRAPRLAPEVLRRFPRARPLAAPLTVSGLAAPVGRALEEAARRAGRPLVAGPRRARAAQTPPVPLVPGAAVMAALASGDLGLGALGTLTYVDGDRFWAFGHPLEGLGRRALLLQDAYVHAVIANPTGAPGVETYKLGSPGADRGVISTDGLSAIAGRLGTLPPTTALTVRARDLDRDVRRTRSTRVADETDAGMPAGTSPLQLVASTAVADAAATIARGTPARQSGEMCLRVRVRELGERLRVCNRYVVAGTPGGLASSALGDVAAGLDLIDRFRFGPLHVEEVDADLRVRAGTALAVMERASAPGRVRAGRVARLRVRVREVHTGERSTVTVPVRLPRDLRAGRHSVVLTGTDADDPEGGLVDGFGFVLAEEEDEGGEAPDTLRELRRAFERIERYDGVRAKIGGRPRERAYVDPQQRLAGRVRVTVRVAKG